ncbi:MAG: DUF1801 domain-containing protein [Bacteroidetes bacterium]|nr:DUF1801 domain-containing protein [Bacteroidota bacterium]
MPAKRSSTVDDYLRHAPKHIRALMQEIRSIILTILPDAEESIKFTVPFYSRKGLLCYLSPLKTKDGIYIGFTKGYLMSDECGVFTGSNLKQIRHIEFRKLSDIKKRSLKAYIKEAAVLNEVKKGPFPFLG